MKKKAVHQLHCPKRYVMLLDGDLYKYTVYHESIGLQVIGYYNVIII